MDLEQRLTQVVDAETGGSRVLVTLLFTDLVGSTERATTLGDEHWRALLERHDATVRDLLDRYWGREIDCAGDGFFATFGIASHAVRCGVALTGSLMALGLQSRVGLHTGECERLGAKVSGVAVHTAARVVRLASPCEVLVTETVRSVVAGSGLHFEDRGRHELKGLPGDWPLYAAVERAPQVRREPLSLGGATARPHRPRRRRSTAAAGRTR